MSDPEIDLSEYENWSAKDCWRAEEQIRLQYDRIQKLQGKVDSLTEKLSQLQKKK